MAALEKFYKPSGKFGLGAPILMVLGGIVAVAILAGVYALAIFYIPFIYINFFLTIGFGFACGVVVSWLGKVGKSRSPGLNLAIGFVVGLVALYAHWAIWILALSEWSVFLLNPSDLFETMRLITLEGAWGIFGWTPSGFALWAIWGIEALIIVGLTVLISSGSGNEVFCERCNQWAEETKLQPRQIGENAEQIVNQLVEGGDIAPLNALPAAVGSDAGFFQSTIASCERCGDLHALTVELVAVQVDDKGEESKEETVLVDKMLISQADRAALN